MKKLVFFVLIIFVISCNQSDPAAERKDGFTKVLKTKEDSLYNAVMEGHDIGMARMGKLRGALIKTQKALDSLHKLQAAKIDPLYQQALRDLQEDLNYAEYGMNTWMEEFKADSAQDNKDQRILYLESEKKKVLRVKEAILNGLQRADSLFK